jgi:cytidylate kinase
VAARRQPVGVITLSRQIGAGETTIAPAVAERLGWECVDHKILDREVEETGLILPYVVHYDERLPGRIDAWGHPDEAERYFAALRRIAATFAAVGKVVLVGRGANFLLGEADALHFRLIADMPYRIRRVMEVRWVNEGPAKEIIARSDRDRAEFVRHYFKADWDDPVHYHAVLNTSMMGMETVVDRIVDAASDRWNLRKEPVL